MSKTNSFPDLASCTVAVIGLGYVGLPLCVEIGKEKKSCISNTILKRKVIGFDIDLQRLEEIQNGLDRTNETTPKELKSAKLLELTNDISILKEADVFIVTVPTPIDSAKRPDLSPLKKASLTVGKALKLRSEYKFKTSQNQSPIVIFESTVYPGATEEVCVPVIEKESNLTFNRDFFCGYSPERINPGDTKHKLTSIIKVTSGSTCNSAEWIDLFYKSIIEAGTHLAPSIKVAEAAKVIENTQRDLNIALVNELAIIFQRMGVDTLDVLEAAGTKWNFLPFKPGLVGGHCISVDPYYLTHKSEELGYRPEVVLAGRRINDGMASWIVQKLVLSMAKKGMEISGSKVLVLGLTFKENCPDLRNTRVIDVIKCLNSYGMEAICFDPWVDAKNASSKYGLDVTNDLPSNKAFNAVVVAVAHKQFKEISTEQWRKLIIKKGVILDLKGITPRELNPIRI